MTAIQLSRTTLSRRAPQALTSVSSPLLAWLQHGRARLHLPERASDIREGALIFLRAGHRFALQGKAPDTYATALSFDPGLIAALPLRHPQLAGQMFWADSPQVLKADLETRTDLAHSAMALDLAPASGLLAEAILLPLLARLSDPAPELPPGAPPWLARVLADAHDPGIFRDGAAGLARAAGRSPAHVARLCRTFTGQTPSEIANRHRMTHAARRLAASDDPLPEIAREVGLANLSHFHKLFRAHHGETPLAYRKAHQLNPLRVK